MKTLLVITLGLSLTGLTATAADNVIKPAAPATPNAPAAPGAPAAATPARLPDQYKKYDANGNGKLDPEEIATMRKEREAELLKTYDKNSNGKLDDDEKQAYRAEMTKKREEAIAKRKSEQEKVLKPEKVDIKKEEKK